MKKFLVNNKECHMVETIEEMTMYQYQMIETLLLNIGRLVDSQLLLNIIEVLSNEELNTLGDIESDVLDDLTKTFTNMQYGDISMYKNDNNHLVIDGVDYAIKKTGDYNFFRASEKIHIDIIRRDMYKYLKGGREWKNYFDLISRVSLPDGDKNKLTMEEFSSELDNLDMDDWNRFLVSKLKSEIDINFTILVIMIQPGYSKFDEERKEEVWIQKEFSNQNLEVRKNILKKSLKALDGIKPLSFFLSGNGVSQKDIQNSLEEKQLLSQEEVPLSQ